LKLPALRERREDIPVLTPHIMERFAGELAMPSREISRAALEKLQRHTWPGIGRELENIIERAMVLSENPLLMAENVRLPGNQPCPQKMSFTALKSRAIAEFETESIRHQLAISHNNSLAARAAQKNRRAFWQLISAALLSLGAPFWFNTLKHLTNRQPVGAKKERQESAAES
jgi:DNA-binding NtrC family response regulator